MLSNEDINMDSSLSLPSPPGYNESVTDTKVSYVYYL